MLDISLIKRMGVCWNEFFDVEYFVLGLRILTFDDLLLIDFQVCLILQGTHLIKVKISHHIHLNTLQRNALLLMRTRQLYNIDVTSWGNESFAESVNLMIFQGKSLESPRLGLFHR